MIKAILFDLDGVLLDAKEIHYEALNMALQKHGCPPINRSAHLGEFDGLPTRIKLEKLAKSGLIEKEKFPLIKIDKQEFTIDLIKRNIKPKNDLIDLMHWIYTEEYATSVCSNSVAETIEVGLEMLKISGYFARTFSNEDVAKPKPDPEIYIKAMRFLNVEPSEVLILEDNENGIAAALASGAHLFRVDDISEVNLHNVQTRLSELKEKNAI